MSGVVELLCSRRAPQVAVLALMSIGFAGCSADMSTRLSQNSFSNPFTSQQEATGSVPPATRAFANCLRLNYGHPWNGLSEQAMRTLGRLAAEAS